MLESSCQACQGIRGAAGVPSRRTPLACRSLTAADLPLVQPFPQVERRRHAKEVMAQLGGKLAEGDAAPAAPAVPAGLSDEQVTWGPAGSSWAAGRRRVYAQATGTRSGVQAVSKVRLPRKHTRSTPHPLDGCVCARRSSRVSQMPAGCLQGVCARPETRGALLHSRAGRAPRAAGAHARAAPAPAGSLSVSCLGTVAFFAQAAQRSPFSACRAWPRAASWPTGRPMRPPPHPVINKQQMPVRAPDVRPCQPRPAHLACRQPTKVTPTPLLYLFPCQSAPRARTFFCAGPSSTLAPLSLFLCFG